MTARQAVEPRDPKVPRPNEGERLTLTAHGVGSIWTLISCPTEHRIVRESDGSPPIVQVMEYPGNEWGLAARFLVAAVEREYRDAGRDTRGTGYCGDCSTALAQDGSCPTHGYVR